MASFFGVAGTLIGTAVVSIVSSLAAAIYAGLLGRSRTLVQRTTTVLRVLPERIEGRAARGSGDGPGGEAGPGPGDEGGAGPEDEGDRRTREGSGGDGEPSGPQSRAGGRAGLPLRRWAVVAGVAVLIFAIAIGALTAIEAMIKEPIATALGARHRGQARTSVGVAVDRAGGSGTTRRPSPSSTTQPSTPPSSGQPGQAPPTTQPGLGTTGGTAPPTTLPPTTRQPPAPFTSGATPSSR